MTDALPAKETVELKYPEGRWERVAIKDYYAAHHRLAFELLTWAYLMPRKSTTRKHFEYW